MRPKIYNVVIHNVLNLLLTPKQMLIFSIFSSCYNVTYVDVNGRLGTT